MATLTLGTNAATSLDPALMFTGNMTAADVASMAAAIKNDQNGAHPVAAPSFAANGLLFVPNRGILKMLPGDYVGIDSTGWPILVSALAISAGPWTHS